MQAFVRSAGLVCLIGILGPAAPGADSVPAAIAPRIAADVFFAPPSFTSVRLSPDGRHLAARSRFDKKHYALTLLDLETLHSEVLVKIPKVSVENYWWKSDHQLIVLTQNDRGGVFYCSIDLRTRQINDLVKVNRRDTTILNLLPEEPDLILVATILGRWPDVQRVNLRTGEMTLVEKNPGYIDSWTTDQHGRVLAGLGYRSEQWHTIWRPSPTSPWQHRIDPGKQPAPIAPLAIDAEGRNLLAIDLTLGSTAALSAIDLATGVKKELFRSEQADVASLDTWGVAEVPYAATYYTDRRHQWFMDQKAEAFAQGVNEALPDNDNRVVSYSADNRRMIVLAMSDRDAGTYYLVDREHGRISALGPMYSGLPPAAMAPSRYFTFQSRDGLKISGRITLPVGVTRPPAIVRVSWTLAPSRSFVFDEFAQALANRGFAFVQIETRGTAGYGRNYLKEGDLQASTGMVHDLEDGVQWLSEQGWIAGDRVAIIGQWYGGIVALQAAVPPTRFRALVNLFIPTDTRHLEVEAFSPSGQQHSELISSLGGTAAANRYLKSLDTLDAFRRLAIPTFSYYYGRSLSGDIVGRALRKRGVDHELFSLPPKFNDETERNESEAAGLITDAIAAFLQKKL